MTYCYKNSQGHDRSLIQRRNRMKINPSLTLPNKYIYKKSLITNVTANAYVKCLLACILNVKSICNLVSFSIVDFPFLIKDDNRYYLLS